MLLTQQETNKMKDKDDQHILEMKKWKADIAERKQVKLVQIPDFIKEKALAEVIMKLYTQFVIGTAFIW